MIFVDSTFAFVLLEKDYGTMIVDESLLRYINILCEGNETERIVEKQGRRRKGLELSRETDFLLGFVWGRRTKQLCPSLESIQRQTSGEGGKLRWSRLVDTFHRLSRFTLPAPDDGEW